MWREVLLFAISSSSQQDILCIRQLFTRNRLSFLGAVMMWEFVCIRPWINVSSKWWVPPEKRRSAQAQLLLLFFFFSSWIWGTLSEWIVLMLCIPCKLRGPHDYYSWAVLSCFVAGEELRICYIDASMDHDARQTILFQGFGFQCHCLRCMSGD